jgi:hypothetical protein
VTGEFNGGGGPGPGQGRRRGRRGRRGGRRRHGGPFGGPPGSGGGGPAQHPQQHRPFAAVGEAHATLSSPGGDRLLSAKVAHDGPVPPAVADRGISPFALFAACILGVTETDGWKPPNAQDVGRRFGLSPGALPQILRALALDVDSLKQCEFDLVGAQMDVQVAPAGVSRTEVAKGLYRDLLALPKRAGVVAAAAASSGPIPEPSPAPGPGPGTRSAGNGGA